MIKSKSNINCNAVKHNFAKTKINEQAMFLVQKGKVTNGFLKMRFQ